MMSLADRWITTFRRNPNAQIRLFCFPYAGAGTLPYRPWADALPPEIEVCAIQLPGRESRFREAALTDVEPLISTLTGLLYPHRLDRPFAFYGHSLGALIAFELARNLIKYYNVAPAHLFVSARIAPHLADSRPPIHLLSEAEFKKTLRELGGTPPEVLDNPEMAPVLETLRADFAMNERYHYVIADPLAVAISVYGGVDDCKVSEQELSAWKMHTSARFDLRMFPGDHFFINSSRPALLRTIVRELALLI
jgi:medium-chain acyl-[acyl-carrier-protein] hydrolase